jgi:glucose uptake protein GlcU
MMILMTLLIAGASMAFAVHQWRRGHHMMAIGFVTFACIIAGIAIESAKDKLTDPMRDSPHVLPRPP